MYNSTQLLQAVNDTINALPLEHNPQGLYAPIRYVLSLGGKRIRPVLMLMAYNLYKDDIKTCLMPAVGIETFHNFTLLHDDLMDRAEVRRGKECVHRKWDDNTAILSGDNMLVLAFQYLTHCDEKKLPAVMQIFSKTAVEIDEGQQYDIEFESRNDVTEAEYIEMIRLKTSVLLACALQIGATLADAPEEDIHELYRFGECLGLAFQLQDDYLDTFMLINALLHASKEDRAELLQWIDSKDCSPEEKISAVTAIYTKTGVDQMAKERMNSYYTEAEASLAKVNIPEERKQMLHELALELMGRQK